VVLLHYADNRNGQTPQTLFNGFEGFLQTDGYAGYNALASGDTITQLGCWAHTRRKFTEVLSSSIPPEESRTLAQEAVALIGRLYAIEREIKAKPPDEKQPIRARRSQPILDAIEVWKETHFFRAQALGGAIAKAFVYLNNQWTKLKVYVTDGRLSIDNNWAENHIRPIALGRKNWLFATSVEGAKAVAVWYSIVETAKANGLDPYRYLNHLLTQFPLYMHEGRELDPLMPWNITEGVLA
jgi:hypothetical protein